MQQRHALRQGRGALREGLTEDVARLTNGHIDTDSIGSGLISPDDAVNVFSIRVVQLQSTPQLFHIDPCAVAAVTAIHVEQQDAPRGCVQQLPAGILGNVGRSLAPEMAAEPLLAGHTVALKQQHIDIPAINIVARGHGKPQLPAPHGDDQLGAAAECLILPLILHGCAAHGHSSHVGVAHVHDPALSLAHFPFHFVGIKHLHLTAFPQHVFLRRFAQPLRAVDHQDIQRQHPQDHAGEKPQGK